VAEHPLSKIKTQCALEAEASARFAEAWHRAERGESVEQQILTFESWDTLARTLTTRRLELLSYVRRHEVSSVRGLAAALGRDYRNVHTDVQALKAAGLLATTAQRIQANYDAIEARIAI